MRDAPSDNHDWLFERFLDELWKQDARHVLDVGCGGGRLLAVARERGISATGVDQEGPRLAALRADGFSVLDGRAEELPFPNDAYDWVTLRHVPHHLEDPARGLAEALRVARIGVLVAEPWFDPAIASQAAALEYDRFEKRQHRRAGRVHGESLRLTDLLGLIPGALSESLEVEAHQWLRLRARDAGAALEEARALVVDLAADDPEHDALARLASRVAEDGLSWNGSVACVLRKAAAGTSA